VEDAVTLDPARLRDMYARMVTIRCFEDAVRQIYLRGEMPGLAHLSIGQEAVAVGSCFALREDDYIVSNHRGHGHCIAKGARLDRMMGEMLGKVTGYCRGKGGTMHIADFEHHNLGATGIVGGGVGLATGVALALQAQGTDRVCLGFFGDGASNQGIVHESFNMAAIWRLPVVYICENNQYGEYTAGRAVTAGERIADRARPFGIPAQCVDGMDVQAVYAVVSEAVKRGRRGEGPSLIECDTYRIYGHHAGDPARYRTEAEVAAWRQRDPIDQLGRHLARQGILDETEQATLLGEATAAVGAALEFARSSPFPDPVELEQHVYA
jgi:pyruvate dehydrogenase E1 component alpha subunit